MVCEYCHNYTNSKLKSSRNILMNIRQKFQVTEHVNEICGNCFKKFKAAERIYIQNTLFK